MASCSVQNQLDRDAFRNVPNHFSAQFYDRPDTIRYQYGDKFYIKSLLKDFIKTDLVNYSKPIEMTIKNEELFLKFEDSSQKISVLKFYGKWYRKKFVFYTNYQTVSFPGLLITKEMSRYTIFLSGDNEIIFRNHYANEGMVLFFGAGNSSVSDRKFKLLKNE